MLAKEIDVDIITENLNDMFSGDFYEYADLPSVLETLAGKIIYLQNKIDELNKITEHLNKN